MTLTRSRRTLGVAGTGLRVSVLVAAVTLTVSAPASDVGARPLDAIRGRGVLSLCAHANALPFASKTGSPPGFQIELAQALAAQLGVRLSVEWVTTGLQFRDADCDIVLEADLRPLRHRASAAQKMKSREAERHSARF